MGRILRVGLMVLLVAAAGVGNVWGEEVWVTSGNWQYAKINETTCRIKPHGSATIEGTVKIPDEVGSLKVVEIATGAFEGCSKLEAVDIPNSVKAIGKAAFYGCVKLMKMFISSSVREIGDNAFSYCKELTAFQVDEGNARYSQDGGVLFTKDMQMLIAYPGGRKGDYEIPGSVTGIVAGAFYGCDGLTAVVIPSSVKTIGKSAFEGCSKLEAVDIPDGMTVIEKSAFEGCSKLEAVDIPDGMTVIEEYAFKGCNMLKEVTIPGSVKTIGVRAFYGCGSLNTVYVYRPVDQEFTVDEAAFLDIGSQATLYVRPGMKEKIKDKPWRINGKIKNIVEFCVVTFTDSDGTKLGEQLVKPNNGTATEPTAPTREGYIFDGWQLDGAKYDFSKPVTKNITLVAVWKEVAKYTVTFDAKGGAPTPGAQKVVKDGTATAPTAPTREGYIFDGWQLDGAKYDFSAPVTKDITLVAEWKKNEESTPSTPKDPKDPETAVESVQLAAVRVVRNPVGEALELEGMERAARVEVYSVAGARVHAEALRGEPRVVIDARGWASGVYVVKVEASDGERTLRVVK